MADLERAREYEADRLWAGVVKETGIWMSPYAEQVADFGRLVIPRMREALAAARDEALEEAARVCDALYDGYSTANTDQTDPEQVWLDACDRAATAIRALRDKGDE